MAMASPRSIEVKVGILILVAAGLLAGFILVMGGVSFQPTYPIFVDFDNPGGIQSGAPVKIAGVKVGKVTEIQFRGGTVDPTSGKREPLVRLRVVVEKRFGPSIHDNSLFYVTSQGVLGEQFLAVEPGSTDRPVLPEGAVVRGLDPPRFDMLLAESYELLHTSVTAMRENRAQIIEAFDGLTKTLKGTGDFFGKNGDRLDRITANVEQMTIDGSDAIKSAKTKFVDNPQIDRVLNNVDTLSATAARDTPALLADARETLANVKRVSATVGGEAEQAKIRQAIGDLSEIAKSAKAATADAQAIAGQIRRGRGTVGAMVMDEELYDDLQEMVRDLKHNPWKFFWRE
jgi:phospholipid/cholesterol/gamma-HCH transport system substrate-binding protein